MPPETMQCEFEDHKVEEIRHLPMRGDTTMWICKEHYNQERRRRAARGLDMPEWESLPRPGDAAS